MTFFEKYTLAEKWDEKILIMNIYHTAMTTKRKGWTLTNTAEYFGVSVALVSENLKLAKDIEKIAKCSSRKEALRKVDGVPYLKYRCTKCDAILNTETALDAHMRIKHHV